MKALAIPVGSRGSGVHVRSILYGAHFAALVGEGNHDQAVKAQPE